LNKYPHLGHSEIAFHLSDVSQFEEAGGLYLVDLVSEGESSVEPKTKILDDWFESYADVAVWAQESSVYGERPQD
jgi:hypothetical protein